MSILKFVRNTQNGEPSRIKHTRPKHACLVCGLDCKHPGGLVVHMRLKHPEEYEQSQKVAKEKADALAKAQAAAQTQIDPLAVAPNAPAVESKSTGSFRPLLQLALFRT